MEDLLTSEPSDNESSVWSDNDLNTTYSSLVSVDLQPLDTRGYGEYPDVLQNKEGPFSVHDMSAIQY